jgi:Tfp pilus assembly protein PilF
LIIRIAPNSLIKVAAFAVIYLLFCSDSAAMQKVNADSLRLAAAKIQDAEVLSSIASELMIADSTNKENIYWFAKAAELRGDHVTAILYSKKILLKDSLYLPALELMFEVAGKDSDKDSRILIAGIVERNFRQHPLSLFMSANIAYGENNLKEAERLAEASQKQSPDNTKTAVLLGLIKMKLERYEDALAIFEDNMESVKSRPDLLNNYGVVLLMLGKFNDAAIVFEQAILADTTQAVYFFNSGLALIRAGDFKKALTSFNHAEQIDDTFQQMQLLKAKCFEQINVTDSALIAYKRYSEENDSPDVQREILLLQATLFIEKNWLFLLTSFLSVIAIVVLLIKRRN